MDEAEFDRFADEYTSLHAHNIRASGEDTTFFARYKVDDVASVLLSRGQEPKQILDFGGGVGNSLGFMLDAFPSSQITLLDPSARSLDIARRRLDGRREAGRARFQAFDGRTIPCPDHSFDLVFAACVFHHIPADLHIPLLRELERVLSPKGNLFIFEHNPFNPVTTRAVNECPFDENAVLISAPEMRRRVRAAGFDADRAIYRLFFPGVLRRLRGLERYLGRLPLGAQYYVHAIKSA